MVNSYGIVLLNKDKILIGHPTRSSGWTLPKGRAESGETPVQAALREFQEETGIDLEQFKDQLVYLGVEVYSSKIKQVHLFLLKTDQEFQEPNCLSMVTDKPGEPYPELDRFQWVTYDEAVKLVFNSQKELLIKNKDKFLDKP